ncbi:hypothetical protein AQ436_04100 [Arthrobacter sp. EpRS66]|nr:hypothetical protein AQ436_04100 [Arthrobacter sp. EpRS66]
MIGPPRDNMPYPNADLPIAARARVDLIGVQRGDPAHMPLPIGRILQPHHAEAGSLQPVVGTGFIF